MTKYFTESALEKQMMQIPKNPRKAIRRFVSSAFRNDVHKSIFEKTVSEYINRGYILSNRFLADVFILSSDAFLWKQCKYKIKPNHIDFDNISINGAKTRSYLLFKTAEDMAAKCTNISISDICERDLVSNDSLIVILGAVYISRYGLHFLENN